MLPNHATETQSPGFIWQREKVLQAGTPFPTAAPFREGHLPVHGELRPMGEKGGGHLFTHDGDKKSLAQRQRLEATVAGLADFRPHPC